MVWTVLTVVQQLEFAALFVLCFLTGDRMRKTIALITKGFYLLLTEMIAVYLIAFPVHAFQVSSSSTGYVRVATASAISAYQVAQRAAFTSAVASAISAPTAASVAVRLATGPVGWGLLGVSAALTLASLYYSAQDVQAVKTAALAAAPPVGTQSNGSGTTLPAGAVWNPASCVHPCAFNAQQYFHVDSVGESSTSCYQGNDGGTFTDPAWPGWTRNNSAISGPTCRRNWTHRNDGTTASSQQEIGFLPPSSLTLGEYQTYVGGLPAANPNSIESKTSPMGQGATAPSAENVTTMPVSPTEVVPTVKPASQVGPTDAVIDPNAPAPAGPQPPVPSTQTTTTTTTTTTNPDGSVTQARGDDRIRLLFSGESRSTHVWIGLAGSHEPVARLRPAQCAESAENADVALGHSHVLALLVVVREFHARFLRLVWPAHGVAIPHHCARGLRRLSHHLCGERMTAILNLIYCFLMDMIQSFRDIWIVGWDSVLTPVDSLSPQWARVG